MRQILQDWAEKVPTDLVPLLGVAAAVIILGLSYAVFDHLVFRRDSSWRVKIIGFVVFTIVLAALFFILISVVKELGPDAIDQNTRPEKDKVGSSVQEPNDYPAQQVQHRIPSLLSIRMETSQLHSPNPPHLPVTAIPLLCLRKPTISLQPYIYHLLLPTRRPHLRRRRCQQCRRRRVLGIRHRPQKQARPSA